MSWNICFLACSSVKMRKIWPVLCNREGRACSSSLPLTAVKFPKAGIYQILQTRFWLSICDSIPGQLSEGRYAAAPWKTLYGWKRRFQIWLLDKTWEGWNSATKTACLNQTQNVASSCWTARKDVAIFRAFFLREYESSKKIITSGLVPYDFICTTAQFCLGQCKLMKNWFADYLYPGSLMKRQRPARCSRMKFPLWIRHFCGHAIHDLHFWEKHSQ